VTLRIAKTVSSETALRQGYKGGASPIYGFCYLDGKLAKDPREYPTLQIIKEQWRRGKTPTEIASYLNGKKIKTRTGKAWKQPTVFYIVERLKKEKQASLKKENQRHES
jgi:hypothetical protein